MKHGTEMITDFERAEPETRGGLRERYELYLAFSTDQ